MKKIEPMFIVIAPGREPMRVRGERSARSYANWKGYKVFVIIKETEYWRDILDSVFDNLKKEGGI